MIYRLIFLCLLCTSASAAQDTYTVNFGVILKNDMGEPVGFEETTAIPVGKANTKTLYGIVVTRNDEQPFTLGTVHVIPTLDSNVTTKVMGKPMQSTNRGAVFLQSDEYDIPGDYAMEVYLDNQLLTTISYQLIKVANVTTPEQDQPNIEIAAK